MNGSLTYLGLMSSRLESCVGRLVLHWGVCDGREFPVGSNIRLLTSMKRQIMINPSQLSCNWPDSPEIKRHEDNLLTKVPNRRAYQTPLI
jgi:hypothetical protein